MKTVLFSSCCAELHNNLHCFFIRKIIPFFIMFCRFVYQYIQFHFTGTSLNQYRSHVCVYIYICSLCCTCILHYMYIIMYLIYMLYLLLCYISFVNLYCTSVCVWYYESLINFEALHSRVVDVTHWVTWTRLVVGGIFK